MQRKVLKRGHCTALISLPRSWVRHNQIEFGEMLDLHVADKEIIISKKREEKEITVDVERLGVWRIHFFSQIYQRGFTRVRFIGLSRQQKELITGRLWNFPYTEVLGESRGTLDLRISDTDSHHSVFLKRLFEITFERLDAILSLTPDMGAAETALHEVYATGELLNRKVNLDVPEIDKYYIQSIPTQLIYINQALHGIQRGLAQNGRALPLELAGLLAVAKNHLKLHYENTYKGTPLDMKKHGEYRNALFHRLHDDFSLFDGIDTRDLYVAEKVFCASRLTAHLCCRNLLFPKFHRLFE